MPDNEDIKFENKKENKAENTAENKSGSENAGSSQNKTDSMKELKEWAQAIITAVVLALLIRSFLFEIIIVDGESMLPTLEDRNRVLVSKIGYIIGKPEHGDVIIFRTPEDPRTSYVKRIIGLPGDKVRITDGIVYVNDEPLDEPYIAERPYFDYEEVTVPEDSFFAMGDNRNNSKDSRDYHVGFVPMKNLVGEAVLRVWPLNDISPIK